MRIFRMFLVAASFLMASFAQAEGYLADTLVRTPNGHVKIQDLKKGDEVFSVYDKAMEGGSCCAKCDKKEEAEAPKKCGGNVRVKPKKIVGIVETRSSNLVQFTIGEETLTLDADAKIFSISDRKFLPATELSSGSIVADIFFRPVLVDKVQLLQTSQPTFVIEVEDNHTFFAGKQNILVHNGPALAAICAVVCEIIHSVGCGAGSFIFWGLNPAFGIVYGAVCAALATGPAVGCASVCLGLPTP